MKAIIDSDKGLVNFMLTDFASMVKDAPDQLHNLTEKSIEAAQTAYD
jgi:hypothetical protein